MIVNQVNFSKYPDQLVPAIIQDAITRNVLMLGYMNKEALTKTLDLKQVTFFSRSKQRLWTKGEESGNYLHLEDIKLDCDQDALLIQATPSGPTCHKGTDTCWAEANTANFGFLSKLEETITDRKMTFKTSHQLQEKPKSYVTSLFNKGINKIAQKVGEEAVEVVIEAKDDNDELFLNESADLLFHYLILLQAKGFKLADVVQVLNNRRKSN
ncbi:bifunctional phosphoribosyl-AMP cyclohydrolase/phosphoribosyl-ATP diphosphatase HisIE [Psychroflexus sp. ALD_RP9]|uniref:bifunctional phosphoribosyl-AMP cyclohydrolase/phosphoribosyl-ATP diphosphatase HisIE n=1 Tax=Psychroflexus sp. ALD_RP9 TaxID=2777186 RepID=UPI001A8F591A|nr:bifunctional phosphoribosyl-AMP cyclohydrolase/phosphoribosyl-ATP diphosphatase HisIE [Psychroflexus sp. ALD_RP9]QSS97077.1 bifunctional phosphoribosyl-AMP cyclohydrolase/phosphoribosyl-ATP diphosphatase HisIE [Psychroflexus sp. ALD_RP9]